MKYYYWLFIGAIIVMELMRCMMNDHAVDAIVVGEGSISVCTEIDQRQGRDCEQMVVITEEIPIGFTTQQRAIGEAFNKEPIIIRKYFKAAEYRKPVTPYRLVDSTYGSRAVGSVYGMTEIKKEAPRTILDVGRDCWIDCGATLINGQTVLNPRLCGVTTGLENAEMRRWDYTFKPFFSTKFPMSCGVPTTEAGQFFDMGPTEIHVQLVIDIEYKGNVTQFELNHNNNVLKAEMPFGTLNLIVTGFSNFVHPPDTSQYLIYRIDQPTLSQDYGTAVFVPRGDVSSMIAHQLFPSSSLKQAPFGEGTIRYPKDYVNADREASYAPTYTIGKNGFFLEEQYLRYPITTTSFLRVTMQLSNIETWEDVIKTSPAKFDKVTLSSEEMEASTIYFIMAGVRLLGKTRSSKTVQVADCQSSIGQTNGTKASRFTAQVITLDEEHPYGVVKIPFSSQSMSEEFLTCTLHLRDNGLLIIEDRYTLSMNMTKPQPWVPWGAMRPCNGSCDTANSGTAMDDLVDFFHKSGLCNVDSFPGNVLASTPLCKRSSIDWVLIGSLAGAASLVVLYLIWVIYSMCFLKRPGYVLCLCICFKQFT